MTCEEVQRLITEKSPVDATRAERNAIFSHCDTCPECVKRLHHGKVGLIGKAEMRRVLLADMADPEAT